MKENKLELTPIREVGSSRGGTLHTSYEDIIETVGLPNVTDLDDPDKVQASWGFQDERGRKGFIWSYKHDDLIEYCNYWSLSGDMNLLKELFNNKVE